MPPDLFPVYLIRVTMITFIKSYIVVTVTSAYLPSMSRSASFQQALVSSSVAADAFSMSRLFNYK